MHPIDPKLSTIIIGFGNPGRQDDGLGPAFVEALEGKVNRTIARQISYQLTVEDALTISKYQQVFFVDASINCQTPFLLTEINETNNTGFGSHSLSPIALIQLTKTLYQHAPKAYILAIRGFEFDQFDEQLSEAAMQNLRHAIEYLTGKLNA